MNHAICIVPLAAVRLTPDHRNEMVNQLLFGEWATVLEKNKEGWALLENKWDGYIGWCRLNQFLLTENLPAPSLRYSANWTNEITVNGENMMLPFGAPIPSASLAGLELQYHGTLHDAAETIFNEENIKRIAEMYLNSSYLWGGKSVFGIDCSAFVQSVYRMMNIPLLRDAKLQVSMGEPVGFLQEAICGDLAFFDEFGEITHAGILLNDHEVIHASGKVRVDHIDADGIVQKGTGIRTHKLRVIKRIQPYI